MHDADVNPPDRASADTPLAALGDGASVLGGALVPDFLGPMPVGLGYFRLLQQPGQPLDGICLYANAAFERQWNQGPVRGRRIGELIPHILDSSAAALELFRRVAGGGGPERVEIHLGSVRQRCLIQAYSPHPGHVAWLQTVIDELRPGDSPRGIYDPNGKLLDLPSMLREISDGKLAEEALRISEERHRLLAEASRDVVWAMSLDGRVTYISPSVETLRGFTPDEAMRQTVDQILTPASQALSLGYYRALYAALQAGEPPPRFKGEQEYLCKDGSTVWTEVTAIPLLDSQGGFVELLGVSRDLSERKRHEIELRAAHRAAREQLEELVHARTLALACARDEAEEASRAKSAFLATMSHELRTPMTQIMGLAYLLADRLEDELSRDWLSKLRGASDHLLKLINAILDYSRLESSTLELACVDLDLPALLAQVEHRFRDAAREQGLDLAFELDAALPQRLRGDPERLEQVLGSLVSNAVKFSERGRVTVRVRQTDRHRGAVSLRFEVQDEGIGMSPQVQSRLGEMFRQGDDSLSRRFGGVGLGLALTKRLLMLMGSRFEWTSAPGQGSRFWFDLRLPLAMAPQDDADDPPSIT